jgi:predicted Zn-ribbon and HTH transcriptional regulator
MVDELPGRCQCHDRNDYSGKPTDRCCLVASLRLVLIENGVVSTLARSCEQHGPCANTSDGIHPRWHAEFFVPGWKANTTTRLAYAPLYCEDCGESLWDSPRLDSRCPACTRRRAGHEQAAPLICCAGVAHGNDVRWHACGHAASHRILDGTTRQIVTHFCEEHATGDVGEIRIDREDPLHPSPQHEWHTVAAHCTGRAILIDRMHCTGCGAERKAGVRCGDDLCPDCRREADREARHKEAESGVLAARPDGTGGHAESGAGRGARSADAWRPDGLPRCGCPISPPGAEIELCGAVATLHAIPDRQALGEPWLREPVYACQAHGYPGEPGWARYQIVTPSPWSFHPLYCEGCSDILPPWHDLTGAYVYGAKCPACKRAAIAAASNHAPQVFQAPMPPPDDFALREIGTLLRERLDRPATLDFAEAVDRLAGRLESSLSAATSVSVPQLEPVLAALEAQNALLREQSALLASPHPPEGLARLAAAVEAQNALLRDLVAPPGLPDALDAQPARGLGGAVRDAGLSVAREVGSVALEGGVRTAGRKLVGLARRTLETVLFKSLGLRPAQRKALGAFLDSAPGRSLVGLVVSVAVEAIPLGSQARREALGHEIRTEALSVLGDKALALLLDPACAGIYDLLAGEAGEAGAPACPEAEPRTGVRVEAGGGGAAEAEPEDSEDAPGAARGRRASVPQGGRGGRR